MTNSYRKLRNLTQGPTRTVATVTSHNLDGTSTVELMSGAFITVLGQEVAVSSKAYIEGNRVISQAADLPYVEIEI
ncbi:hypothetical protein [Rheinheimera salexigens]|uniref:Uncharacterized protein n=1 Tax=Rheinheimera salexigens TaxID=1628148 RepID=A0A1E7Q8D7_9GAMM|nr:hypothetical protein [Rheinheimera salexigens]OEY70323.1 hypothetical protein BI198_12650 [Rheinheimera salexigens]